MDRLDRKWSGLNSMFPPRSDIQQFKDLQASKPTPPPRVGYDLKPEGASDQDWQGYLAGKAASKKQRDEGFMGRITLEGEAGYDRWKQYQGKQGYLRPLIAQEDRRSEGRMIPDWQQEHPLWQPDPLDPSRPMQVADRGGYLPRPSAMGSNMGKIPPKVGYDLKPEGASDQDWQGYLDAKAVNEKERAEGDLSRDVRRGEAGYEHWKQEQGKRGYLSSLMGQPDPLRIDVVNPLWEPPATQPATIPLPQPPVMPTPSPPTTMPLPQPPVMSTPSPPTTGGPFGGGGKTFLNRFERLLDGLEGLVGKLGADGSTPESPFSSGGGGLSDAIETPFTPTQDY